VIAVKETDIKKMVRLMATDIDGNISIINALRKVKGISFTFSHGVCVGTGTDPRAKIGALSDSELKALEDGIKNPAHAPQWLLNRRKDPETGRNMHLIGTQIDLAKREDINVLRRIRSYRGIRHQAGLPVRGQRTRSSFRTSKKTVGVIKKTARAAAKGKVGKEKK